MHAKYWQLCLTHWLHGPADLQIGPYDQEWIFLENRWTKPDRAPSISLGDIVTWWLGAGALSLNLSASQLSIWKVGLERIPNVTRMSWGSNKIRQRTCFARSRHLDVLNKCQHDLWGQDVRNWSIRISVRILCLIYLKPPRGGRREGKRKSDNQNCWFSSWITLGFMVGPWSSFRCRVRLPKWRSQLTRARELGRSELLSWGKTVLDRITEHSEWYTEL